jgi:hypothetical protein
MRKSVKNKTFDIVHIIFAAMYVQSCTVLCTFTPITGSCSNLYLEKYNDQTPEKWAAESGPAEARAKPEAGGGGVLLPAGLHPAPRRCQVSLQAPHPSGGHQLYRNVPVVVLSGCYGWFQMVLSGSLWFSMFLMHLISWFHVVFMVGSYYYSTVQSSCRRCQIGINCLL